MNEEVKEGGIMNEEVKESIEVETKEKKPAIPLALDTKLEGVRTNLANWMLIIAAFVMFLGTVGIISTAVQEKSWIFWVAITALCLLGVSLLAGLETHISYVGALMLDESKASLWDKCSTVCLWIQAMTLGFGILGTIVAMVAYWVKPLATTAPF